MRVTDARINFELINVIAQNSCNFTSSTAKSFSDLSLLNIQSKLQKPFMTLEQNQAILDGSLNNFAIPDQIFNTSELENFLTSDNQQFNVIGQGNIAFFSDDVSDGNCLFSDVWVKATLGNNYNFIGVTLDFGEFYPKKVTVEYYKENIRMASKTIDEIDKHDIFFNIRALDIDEVKVIFEESWAPYQYANLQEFLLGNVIEWTSKDIVNSNLQEETDVISKVIPNDTLSLTIYSKDEDFNILNPRNSYGYLLPNQKLTVTEFIYDLDDTTGEILDKQEISMGQFYLDTWESINTTQIKFNLVSPLAQLDKTQFKNSRMYGGSSTDNAYSVLQTIFNDAGWTDYEIDNSLQNIYLTGYIPVCTHKQAIQQVAFVCGCVVYDSRSNTVEIKPFIASTNQNIESSNIFDPIKVQRKESVTGLTINVHNFELKNTLEEVFKGNLSTGTHEIVFSSPCTNIAVSSGSATITTRGINYAVLNVTQSGEIILNGYKYEDKSYKYIKEITDETTVKKNTLDIDKATLINSNNVEELAEKWINYFRMYNLVIEFKFISNGQLTGQNITFTDNEGKVFTGAFLRQNIDLGKGFLSSCNLLGYQVLELSNSKPLYAGDDEVEHSAVELYSNEDFGII